MWKRWISTWCIIAICAGVSIASSVEGDLDFGVPGIKRQNAPGGVNETQVSEVTYRLDLRCWLNPRKVLTIACDLNPQNNFAVCVEQL